MTRMSKLHNLSYLLLYLCGSWFGVAHAQLPPPVAQALAKAGVPEAGVGIYVHEIGAAEPLVAHRADQPLNPASVMKLVTTYAGLEIGRAHV